MSGKSDAMSQTARILVDLDALLDTRLGTVHRIDPEKASVLVRDDRYYLRQRDDFSEIIDVGAEQFAAAYAQRDVETLKHSRVTNVVLILGELIGKMEQRYSSEPLAPRPEIHVNVWPYKLSSAEQAMVANAVISYASIETPVRTVSIAHKDLTMRRIRESYAMLIMYDYADWTKLHMQEMHSTPAPAVTLFVPAVAAGQIPTADQMEDMGLNGELDPFRAMELTYAEFIGLDAMPPYQFCIHRPDKLQEWNQRYFRDLPQGQQVEWRSPEDKL